MSEKRWTKPLFLASLVGLAVCCTGCVNESTDGQTQVFTYDLWVPGVIALAGIVALPVGWFTRNMGKGGGWAILAVGAVALVGIAPSLAMERTQLDDQALSVRTGIWGMSSYHVPLDGLRQVRITEEEKRGRRGRKTKSTYLLCEQQDGSVIKVGVNNQITRAASTHFLQKVAERGIPVVDGQSGGV